MAEIIRRDAQTHLLVAFLGVMVEGGIATIKILGNAQADVAMEDRAKEIFMNVGLCFFSIVEEL